MSPPNFALFPVPSDGSSCFQVTLAAWNPASPRPANIASGAINLRTHDCGTLYLRSPGSRIWICSVGCRDDADDIYPFEPFLDTGSADYEIDVVVGTASVSDATGFGPTPVAVLRGFGLLLCTAPPSTNGDGIQITVLASGPSGSGSFAADLESGQVTIVVGYSSLRQTLWNSEIIEGP